MLKKLIAVLLAISLATAPAAAKPKSFDDMTPKETEMFCKKAVLVADDVIVGAAIAFVVTWLVARVGLEFLENWARGKQIEELKAQAKKRCTI